MAKLILFLLCLSRFALADGRTWRDWVSPERFRALAVELAPRVDLFAKIWEADPSAQLYGGTSRDYLWFLRGELSKATSPGDLERRIEELRHRPIEIREFVVGQSDVDVISSAYLGAIDFDRGFLTRLETVSPSWFKPGDSRFEQEKIQGYVPVEKIRLGKGGFHSIDGLDQGDGVREIYDGRPSLHYDPAIRETAFFKEHTNHPLLLALRYLRQVAVTYYRLYGTGYPEKAKLLSLVDDKSRASLDAIFADLDAAPHELEPFLVTPQFRSRLNKALVKAFRSYTNPTAAKLLFELFGVDKRLGLYGSRIDPYHTLMYRRYDDPEAIARQRAMLSVPQEAYVRTAGSYFAEKGLSPEADGTLAAFHGTDKMENYRSIVFQGNIASQSGSAGPGVYVVDSRSRSFAEKWRGDGTLVVQLKLDPKATLVDITEGEGKRAFDEFASLRANGRQDVHNAFAEFVGADILRYPYNDTKAYVVKNGSAIKGQLPVTIPLLSLQEVKARITGSTAPIDEFVKIASFDASIFAHWDYLMGGVPREISGHLRDLLRCAIGKNKPFPALLTDPIWRKYPEYFYPGLSSALDYAIRSGDQSSLRLFLENVLTKPAPPGFDPRLDDVIGAASETSLLIQMTRSESLGPHEEKLRERIGTLLSGWAAESEALPLIEYYIGRSPADPAAAVSEALLKFGKVLSRDKPMAVIGPALFREDNPIWAGHPGARARAMEALVRRVLDLQEHEKLAPLVRHVFFRPDAAEMEDALYLIARGSKNLPTLEALAALLDSGEPRPRDEALRRLVAEKIVERLASSAKWENRAAALLPFYFRFSGKPVAEMVDGLLDSAKNRFPENRPVLKAIASGPFAESYPGELSDKLLEKLVLTSRDYFVYQELVEKVFSRAETKDLVLPRRLLAQRIYRLVSRPPAIGKYRLPSLIDFYLRNIGKQPEAAISDILLANASHKRAYVYDAVAKFIAAQPDPLRHRDALKACISATLDTGALAGIANNAFSVPEIIQDAELNALFLSQLKRLNEKSKLKGASGNAFIDWIAASGSPMLRGWARVMAEQRRPREGGAGCASALSGMGF